MRVGANVEVEGLLAHRAVAVTPSDAADLPDGVTTVGLYVGGAGDVHVTLQGGSDVTFKSVPGGTLLRVAARRVWATGTTATNIVALYW